MRTAHTQIVFGLSLLVLGELHAAPQPFISPGEILESIGGFFGGKTSNGVKPNATEYEGAPAPQEEEIPCNRRRKRDDSYGAPEVNDPCGVFQETDSYIPAEPSVDDGKKPAASTDDKNCKWVQATVFKVKYSTECEDKTSSHCVQTYQTVCKDTVSYECRTEYDEQCTTTDVEECTTAEAQSIEVEECETVFNTVTETVTEEVCTLHYQDVCTNSYGYSLNCVQVPQKNCENVDKTVPKEVPSQECKTVTKTAEPQQTCVTVPKETCNSIPTESCANVPRSDCSLVATGEGCKKLPERHCKQKPIQYPVTERKKVCDDPK